MVLTLKRSYGLKPKIDGCSSKLEMAEAALRQALDKAAQNLKKEEIFEALIGEPARKLRYKPSPKMKKVKPIRKTRKTRKSKVAGLVPEPAVQRQNEVIGEIQPTSDQCSDIDLYTRGTALAEPRRSTYDNSFDNFFLGNSNPDHTNQCPEGTIIHFPNSFSEVEATFAENSELMKDTWAPPQEEGTYTGDHFFPDQLPVLNIDGFSGREYFEDWLY